MAKKLVPNPEYADAAYELGWTDRHGKRVDGRCPDPLPMRFNTPWPDDLKTGDQVLAWAIANQIPSHIEVEE